MKKVIIIGAGPAGLTAAYELSNYTDSYTIALHESCSMVGGLSKTYEFNGNRIDVGGHRFFTQNRKIEKIWNEVLPVSEKQMTIVKRSSHILYRGHMIKYPIQISINTLSAVGIKAGIQILWDQVKNKSDRYHIKTLEDFYIKRFGSTLYSLFFKEYTKKVWGLEASKLSADWGEQRVGRISSKTFLTTRSNNKKAERSLIQSFMFPTFGSGQFWEKMRDIVDERGVQINLSSEAIKIIRKSDGKYEVLFLEDDNKYHKEESDIVISSMPINRMVSVFEGCPSYIKKIADGLQYRSMILVAFAIPKADRGITLINNPTDCWIYIQDREIKAGRLQIFNNWSPNMVKDQDCVLLELEYCCDKNDNMWNMSDELLKNLAMGELKRSLIVSNRIGTDIHSIVLRIENAYPIYAGSYKELSVLRKWINQIDNIYCIGRNGQHHYNNMDHSMETAIKAVDYIIGKSVHKENIWAVNSQPIYHETER